MQGLFMNRCKKCGRFAKQINICMMKCNSHGYQQTEAGRWYQERKRGIAWEKFSYSIIRAMDAFVRRNNLCKGLCKGYFYTKPNLFYRVTRWRLIN